MQSITLQKMFLTRWNSLGLIKYRFYSRCFLSNISHASSQSSDIHDDENLPDQKQTLNITKAINENTTTNNEWLWAYLRDRKTFADLNEDQRRRVIEIG